MLFQGAIPGYFETKLRFEVPIEIRTPNTESQKTKIYTSLYLNHYKSESKHIVKPTIKNIEAVGWLVTGRHRHPTSNVQALNGQRNHKAHFNTQSRTSWSRFLAYKGTFPLTRARIGGLISLYLSWWLLYGGIKHTHVSGDGKKNTQTKNFRGWNLEILERRGKNNFNVQGRIHIVLVLVEVFTLLGFSLDPIAQMGGRSCFFSFLLYWWLSICRLRTHTHTHMEEIETSLRKRFWKGGWIFSKSWRIWKLGSTCMHTHGDEATKTHTHRAHST